MSIIAGAMNIKNGFLGLRKEKDMRIMFFHIMHAIFVNIPPH